MPFIIWIFRHKLSANLLLIGLYSLATPSIERVWFRGFSDFLTSYFINGLGLVFAPASICPIDYGKHETIIQMLCFISHRHLDRLTWLGDNEVYNYSPFDFPYHCNRTSHSPESISLKDSPFPFVSHPAVSSDAVKVGFTVIGYRSENLTHITM